MKKLLLVFSLVCLIWVYGGTSFATESSTDIPEMNFETWMLSMQARQAKVDIIKKNNIQITTLKEELKNNIIIAAEKVNNLKLDISSGTVNISDEDINELKILLEFLQDSTVTLNDEVEKISREINDILDLIQTRGMELGQYDLIIENQNSVIVKMKSILETVNQI